MRFREKYTSGRGDGAGSVAGGNVAGGKVPLRSGNALAAITHADAMAKMVLHCEQRALIALTSVVALHVHDSAG